MSDARQQRHSLPMPEPFNQRVAAMKWASAFLGTWPSTWPTSKRAPRKSFKNQEAASKNGLEAWNTSHYSRAPPLLSQATRLRSTESITKRKKSSLTSAHDPPFQTSPALIPFPISPAPPFLTSIFFPS